MKILITGAGGQLGCELQRQLAGGRSAFSKMPAIFEGAKVTAKNHSGLDVSVCSDFLRCAKAENPDVIIHCASLTDVDGCEANPDSALRVNAVGARNAAMAASETGARLVYISTDYVFSGDGSQPYREWDVCAPGCVYGQTKLLGERYVSEFCDRYIIIRTAWSYGHSERNFIKAILNAAKGKKEIMVVSDQRGNPTSVEDLAWHILRIADTEEYGIYHCSGEGIASRYEFADEIVRLSGIGCKVVPCSTAQFPRPAKRPAYAALDRGMLRSVVGDHMRPWRDALESFMNSLYEGGSL